MTDDAGANRKGAGAEEPGVRLIVGLGNPGSKYAGTRHNVGFDVVDQLARERGLNWRREKKWKVELARSADGSLALAKPQTYMNLSGEAVAKVCGFFKIPPAEVLVVYDDADLPLGRLRLRLCGSAGGHNGVKSIIHHFGGDQFARLKFGIGRDLSAGAAPPVGRDMVGHVLGRFAPDERESLEKCLARAVDAVNCALSTGLAEAMTRFNQNPDQPPRPRKPKARREPDPAESPNDKQNKDQNQNDLSRPSGDQASPAGKPAQES